MKRRREDVNRSEELLQKLLQGEAYGAPLGLAHFYLYCGELDKAMDWSEKAIQQRQPGGPKRPGIVTQHGAQDLGRGFLQTLWTPKSIS